MNKKEAEVSPYKRHDSKDKKVFWIKFCVEQQNCPKFNNLV